ncbi:hypothetical protein [Pseudomonas sp. F1002]|uniref:hypothetical protein n=1 Tax=Pseudomonas sp. F1002 TaxID=2738821 RepID=UPI001C433E06|nr:hypothetical protein [Pseudomonas sp. F1002]
MTKSLRGKRAEVEFAGYDHRVAAEVPAFGTKSRKKRRNRGNSSETIHFGTP